MPENEDLLRLILDSVPVGISYIDRRRKFRFANERYRHFLGLQPKKLIGKTLRQLIGQKRYKIAGQYVKRALAGETVTFENTLPGKNGGEIPVKVMYVPHFGRDKSVEGFFALVEDITGHKAAEEAVTTSEQRQRIILESALDGIITIDGTGKIVEFNPVAENIFGFRSEEVRGKELAETIIPPRLRGKHRAGFRRYLKTGKHKILEQRIEIMAIRANGEEFPVELTITPYIVGGDQFFTGFLRDITERKRAEEVLQESKDHLGVAIESMSDGFSFYDAEGKLVLCNQKQRDFFSYLGDIYRPGVNREDIIRRHATARHEKDPTFDVEGFLDERLKQINTPRPDIEYQLPDGRWVSMREGAVAGGGLVSIRTDITERKRIERELRDARDELEAHVEERTKELRQSEERFRLAFENAPVGLALITPEGSRLKVNQALADFLGYTVEELADTEMKSTAADFDDLDKSMRLRQQVLDGEITTYETRDATATSWDMSFGVRFPARCSEMKTGIRSISSPTPLILPSASRLRRRSRKARNASETSPIIRLRSSPSRTMTGVSDSSTRNTSICSVFSRRTSWERSTSKSSLKIKRKKPPPRTGRSLRQKPPTRWKGRLPPCKEPAIFLSPSFPFSMARAKSHE